MYSNTFAMVGGQHKICGQYLDLYLKWDSVFVIVTYYGLDGSFSNPGMGKKIFLKIHIVE
jgi:hypothetical protein